MNSHTISGFLLLLFTSILALSASGQEIVNIFIVDKSGNPIEGALVTIEDKEETGLSFHYTNEEGKITLSGFSKSAYWIKVTSINFNPSKERVVIGQNSYTIRLSEKVYTLDSVRVRQRQRPKMVSRGDTTIFRVKDFVTPGDNSLEDVIRKLPGVEISSQGIIRFKGKTIGSLTVEGDDLLGNMYSGNIQLAS